MKAISNSPVHVYSVHTVSLYVVVYLLSERNLVTRAECGTLLCAISEETFDQTVLSVQRTKTPDVMGKTADILEECTSFPTVAKKLRGKCLFCLYTSTGMAVGCM